MAHLFGMRGRGARPWKRALVASYVALPLAAFSASAQVSPDPNFGGGQLDLGPPQVSNPTPRADSLAAAAEAGSAEAQYQYGRFHELGIEGMVQDYDIASSWYVRAAEQDHIFALLSVSTMLLGSNPTEAMRYVLRAAELGSAEGQWRAGQVLSGRIPITGVTVDREASFRWYERAAEQEHVGGLSALADLYTAPDTPARHAEGALLYERAAAAGGNAWVFLRLGMISAIGEGVTRDDAVAREWLSSLGTVVQVNPDQFSNEDLDFLGGLQAYYGMDFASGATTEPNPVVVRDALSRALLAPENLAHPALRRTAGVLLRLSGN